MNVIPVRIGKLSKSDNCSIGQTDISTRDVATVPTQFSRWGFSWNIVYGDVGLRFGFKAPSLAQPNHIYSTGQRSGKDGRKGRGRVEIGQT